jgi:predicted RNA-binding protein YlxR (DUF448 family)
MRYVLLFAALIPALAFAQDKNYSAAQLIAAMKAAKPSGGIYVRLRMEHRDAAGKQTVLQAQLKRRSTADGGTETLYQLLFPKERKGEALLLRVKDGSFSGTAFKPGQGRRALKESDRSSGIFGTALTIDDAIAEFLDWQQQEITGKEKEGAVPCTVIESRAPRSSSSGVTIVKSWIDETRLTAMRIDCFKDAGTPVRTVLTHKVLRGSSGYYAPSSFTVTDHATGASTKVEGVRSDKDITYTDADFSDSALETIAAPAAN